MTADSTENTVARITKDIEMFDTNSKELSFSDKGARKVFELSKMYASDARSWLAKGDLYTAFSSISYAHGLLDALRELYGA